MLRLLGLVCIGALSSFAADQDAIAYGKYLLEEVAKCGECHTPRTEAGAPDKSKLLKGATLDFQPLHEMKEWHKATPDLTPSGRLFMRWGAPGMQKFLETGVGPAGRRAEPPMPAYTLRPHDAAAIVAYLQSLK